MMRIDVVGWLVATYFLVSVLLFARPCQYVGSCPTAASLCHSCIDKGMTAREFLVGLFVSQLIVTQTSVYWRSYSAR